MRVLDLDMDYFMTKVAHTRFSSSQRLSEELYGESVWPAAEVRRFLEENLGLSRTHKIPGRVVCGHDEVLSFWKELIEDEMLSMLPFLFL